MVKYIRIIIIILILFLSIFWIKSCNGKRVEKKEKAKTESESSQKRTNSSNKTLVLPDVYTEDHPLLTKDKPVRVKVPSGYSYTCSGGGKKYYHQDQNGPKEIWGDGQYHDAGKHVAYFDLYFYDEEITVVCEFKKL